MEIAPLTSPRTLKYFITEMRHRGIKNVKQMSTKEFKQAVRVHYAENSDSLMKDLNTAKELILWEVTRSSRKSVIAVLLSHRDVRLRLEALINERFEQTILGQPPLVH